MDWSWRILYLVVVATGKGHPGPWKEEKTRTSQQWFHPLLSPLYRCALPGSPGAVWGWSEEAWDISEDLLQNIWIHLHWLLYALGATGSWEGTWVDWKNWPWRWCYKICTEVSGQSHSNGRHIHKHSLHGAEQSEAYRHSHVLLCKGHSEGLLAWARTQTHFRRGSEPPGGAHYAPFWFVFPEAGADGRYWQVSCKGLGLPLHIPISTREPLWTHDIVLTYFVS